MDILLDSGDTTGIFALDNVNKLFGRRNVALPYYLAVFYNINGRIGADIADDFKVDLNLAVDLDNILFTHLRAVNVHYHGNGAIERGKIKHIIYLHSLACGNMVYNVAVLYAVYVHTY